MTPRRRRARVGEASPPPYATGHPTRLLLDSNAWIWFVADSPRLGAAARNAIARAAEVFLSAASAWEIGIKAHTGRLRLPRGMDLSAELARRNVAPLSVTVDHAMAAAALPPIHRDPFDRMLVAQAQLEGLTLITSDAALARYRVAVLAAR